MRWPRHGEAGPMIRNVLASTRRVGSWWTCVAVGAMMPACGAQELDTPQIVVGDSAGVMVVESRLPLLEREAAWRLSSKPNLVVGESAGVGDLEIALSGVTSAFRLNGGQLVIAEQASPPGVHVFNLRGRRIGSIGRAGEGPGEYSRVSAVWPVGGDSVAVLDRNMKRVHVFDWQGAHGRTEDYAGLPSGGLARGGAVPMSVMPGAFADGSRAANHLWRLIPPGGGSGRAYEFVLRVLPGGEVVDTVGRFPTFDYLTLRSGATVPQLFGYVTGALALRSGYYTGGGEGFVIDHYDPTGKHIRRLRRAFRPRRVSRSLIEATFRTMMSDTGIEDARGAMKVLRERIAHRTLPPFGDDWVSDADENLWIPEFPVPGESHRDWTVISSETGAWLTVVRAPANFRITDINDGQVVGIWTSDYGEESVRQYTLIR